MKPSTRNSLLSSTQLAIYALLMVLGEQILKQAFSSTSSFINIIEAHVVLEKNDYGQSLILNGEDGRGGGGDQLVISGNTGNGDGQSSNTILQDAANRDGDVVINGRNIIVPGEDGHIVLADSRSNEQSQSQPQMPNILGLWLPYLYGSNAYRILPYLRGFY